MRLLWAALPLGAVGRGAADLSRVRARLVEAAPRLASKPLRAGRAVPEALRTGGARRAGSG